MSIQIIGLRPYEDKDGKTKIKHQLFLELEAAQFGVIFQDPTAILSRIKPEEHWNLYYTALDCMDRKETRGALRRFKSQKIIPFDIDGIDTTKLDHYIDLFFNTLKLDREKTGIVFSGNGLQFAIELEQAFTSPKFFDEHRVLYKAILSRLDAAMREAGLPGSADPAVWSPARLLRFPETENRKPKKGTKHAKLLSKKGGLGPQRFDWHELSQIENLKPDDHLADFNPNIFPEIDTATVINECSFLKWTRENPEEVREPHYYAAVSILARMENGNALCQNLATAIRNSGSDSSVASFSPADIERKVQQAIEASGPRTCKNIENHWGGCRECKHYGKVSCPINIRSDDFIATAKTGFYFRGKKGLLPDYDGLAKFFDQTHHHKTNRDNGLVYAWDEDHYRVMSKDEVLAFAHEHFNPKPKANVVEEFYKWVRRTNLVHPHFFNENINGLLNCKNGILDLRTKKLQPHTPDYGFKYCLPYEYDPEAKAERFDKFLNEVLDNDVDKRKIIEEFGGYALSGDRCWVHKALLLVGEGSNGKSTFIETLQMVAGDDNYSNVELEDLRNENNRQLLEGKLFNITEEISHNDMRETKIFKNVVAGGRMRVKLMWNQPYFIENRAKLIYGCNKLPASSDVSHGFLRRMIIVDFDQRFEGSRVDRFIKEKLAKELPGILNIFLAGYDRLREQGQFTKSKRVDETIEEYSEENNVVKLWMSETGCVQVNELNGRNKFVSTDDLHREFLMWTHGKGDTERKQSVSFVEFGRLFQAAIEKGKERTGRKTMGNAKKRGYFDIELTKMDD